MDVVLVDGFSLTINHSPSTHQPSFSQIFEKIAHQRAGFRFTNAAINFGHVMARGAMEYSGAMFNAAAFGIIRAEINALDARKRKGVSAHRAWLERDVKIEMI